MPPWAAEKKETIPQLEPFNGREPPSSNEIRDLCRFHSPECVDILMDVARFSKSDQARLAAANAILDRGWGKPVQSLADPDGSPLGSGFFSRLQGLDIQELRSLAIDAEFSIISATQPEEPPKRKRGRPRKALPQGDGEA
jgi:hypothetical protein